jgi:DNA-directed RNA polymerase IV and V subunit 2
MTETKQINIGLLPVMVKSNLCWLHKSQKGDCPFDFGGYFLIKGTEKVPPYMIHAAHSILSKCI